MRDLIRRPVGMVTAGLLAAVMVAVAGATGAAAVSTAWTEVVAVPPANADTSQGATFGSVSCAAPGDCTAVGEYEDSSGNSQGLLLTETSGNWAPGVEAPPPANAEPNRFTSVGSVSCAAPGDCTAVGNYVDSSGNPQVFLLTETSGNWAAGVEGVLPANAGTNPNYGAFLSSVSCASVGNCTAIGGYTDSSGNGQLLLMTETSGIWGTGVDAVLPANAGPNSEASLYQVSCGAPGDCTAVGFYTDSSGNFQGLLVTETSGTWAPGLEAVLPANAGPDPSAALYSVSCASAGNCTAVGSYGDSSGTGQGLMLTEASGSWAAGVELVVPPNAGTHPGGTLVSVSCASAGNCTAVGRTPPGGSTMGLLATETSGTWAPAVVAPMPADASNPLVVLLSVSCASPGNCTAVGYYATVGSAPGLLLTQTSGTWTEVEPPLPPDGIADVFPQSVSCAAPGNCSAVGNDPTTSGPEAGVLWNQTPLTQAATTTALASSANPSASGQAVTYTATVSPTPDGGTVSFTDNGSPITGCGSQPVDTGSGAASCATTPATTGAHNIVAAFSGSGGFTGSTSATLTQVVTVTPCQSLAGCNLSGANLSNAQLPGANLSGANLKGANLSGANLSGASLSGANLNKANLSGVNLSGANLSGANLNSANLTGANLSGANVTGANLGKVTWSNTTCPDGTNSNADGGTCAGHL